MLAGIRLLMSNHKSELQPRQLQRIIQNRFGTLPSNISRQDFPRVSLLAINGQSYYSRLYPESELEKAARHLWGCSLREKFEISVPKIQQTCFTSIAGRKCFAVLEEELGGKQIGHRT